MKQCDRTFETPQVAILNERGLRPGQAQKFNRLILFKLRQAHGLDDRFSRLRRQGLLTQEEMADLLGVCVQTVKQWRYAGLLRAQVFNDKGSCLYERPGDNAPRVKPRDDLSVFADTRSSQIVQMRCSAVRKPSLAGHAEGS